MLRVCIVVDVENFLSLKQGNPRWNSWERFRGKINNLIKNLRYDKKGFDKIYNLIKKEKFPISFMLVGSLFKPREKLEFIDYGYHTLNHFPLTLIDDKKVERETKNIYSSVSFSPPLWMIEDIKNPERIFRVLKKQKYKIIVYRGTDDGLKYNHYDTIKKPEKRQGILCVHKSNDFTGKTSKRKIISIINEVKKNSKKDAVYCITTHDFVHKNLYNFKWLIKSLKRMENQKLIKIINLAQVIKSQNI